MSKNLSDLHILLSFLIDRLDHLLFIFVACSRENIKVEKIMLNIQKLEFMKNLFKSLCIVLFLAGNSAFGQNTSSRVIKVIRCKTFHVSVGIGIITVDSDVTGCLVTIDGVPVVLWGKGASEKQPESEIHYIYVEERELMKKLNIKDPEDLRNMKIIKSGIWDSEGVHYVAVPNGKIERTDVEGTVYYAVPVEKTE